MNRMGRFLMLLICLLLCTASAAAMTEDFVPVYFSKKQTLPVYSAPSSKSWRGAKGKASVSTGGEVWAAGWDGNWLMVFYETNNGAGRVGYVDKKKIKGKLEFDTQLNFAQIPAEVLYSCELTDDIMLASSSITALRPGDRVTYLATFGQWHYVETKVDKKVARGFVPSQCLDIAEPVTPTGEVIRIFDPMPDRRIILNAWPSDAPENSVRVDRPAEGMALVLPDNTLSYREQLELPFAVCYGTDITGDIRITGKDGTALCTLPNDGSGLAWGRIEASGSLPGVDYLIAGAGEVEACGTVTVTANADREARERMSILSDTLESYMLQVCGDDLFSAGAMAKAAAFVKQQPGIEWAAMDGEQLLYADVSGIMGVWSSASYDYRQDLRRPGIVLSIHADNYTYGHAWVSVTNNTDHMVRIGEFPLPSGDTITLGTRGGWLNTAPYQALDLVTFSREMDCDIGDHMGGGVAINYEAAYPENYTSIATLSAVIDEQALVTIDQHVKSYQNYDLWHNNCAFFATGLWNDCVPEAYRFDFHYIDMLPPFLNLLILEASPFQFCHAYAPPVVKTEDDIFFMTREDRLYSRVLEKPESYSATYDHRSGDVIVNWEKVSGDLYGQELPITEYRVGYHDLQNGDCDLNGYIWKRVSRDKFSCRIQGLEDGHAYMIALMPVVEGDFFLYNAAKMFVVIDAGLLDGYVFDANGDPVEHALVTAECEHNGSFKKTAVTDANGYYAFEHFPYNIYDLTATAPLGPGEAHCSVEHGEEHVQAPDLILPLTNHSYTFAARLNDDSADVILCELDDRGCLRGLNNGFSIAKVTEIAPASTISPAVHQVHIRGWVLENGDVFVQTFVNLKQYKGGFQQRCGYILYRTGKDGLQELVRAETSSYNNMLMIKDHRTGREETVMIDTGWIELIQDAFRDWGLEFNRNRDSSGKAFADVSLTASDNGYFGYWGSNDLPVRFDYNHILEVGRRYYIAPPMSEGSAIAALTEDFKAAGLTVKQVERVERDARNGDPAYVRYTFAESGGSTVKVDIRTEDDVIFRLIIEDPTSRGMLYKSADAVGKLEVSDGMRYLYNGVLPMPTLGLSQDAVSTMLAYDLGWTEKVSDAREYGVMGYAGAEGISAVFHRYYWRVGSEYLACELVLTLDR